MLTSEQKQQISALFNDLGANLDITDTQYNNAVASYHAIGEQLSKDGSLLKPYRPHIRPQGSFMLGTMIKPIHDDDDLDIDLICQLTGKYSDWAQIDLKKIVGQQLAANAMYKDMLELPDGKRCWTLQYRKNSDYDKDKYHMDILPSIVNSDYDIIVNESLARFSSAELGSYAIRITDKTLPNYEWDTNHLNWLKSNPIGYGKWFFMRASLTGELRMIKESIDPVPQNNTRTKLPLQRVVQLLKRHRDIMFNGDEAKPISIIITTLAAKAYGQQSEVFDAFVDIVGKMASFIEERSDATGKTIKWVSNPVNEEENFADRWMTHPERQVNFYKWLSQLQQDVQAMVGAGDRGLQWVCESMAKPFGEKVVQKTFADYGLRNRDLRISGGQTIAASGILGAAGGLKVQNHNFDGCDE